MLSTEEVGLDDEQEDGSKDMNDQDNQDDLWSE